MYQVLRDGMTKGTSTTMERRTVRQAHKMRQSCLFIEQIFCKNYNFPEGLAWEVSEF